MAKKQTAAAKLQATIKRLQNFLNYLKAYLKKHVSLKMFIANTKAFFNELCNVKSKLKKIEGRINYEKYKLKKTELILAQNQEHFFLKGRSLNQTR